MSFGYAIFPLFIFNIKVGFGFAVLPLSTLTSNVDLDYAFFLDLFFKSGVLALLFVLHLFSL